LKNTFRVFRAIPLPDIISKKNAHYNPLRIAKEFVKFNERSLVQLLGDMRNDNFVVEIIPDFDEMYFRLRAIDFDQECFEGSSRIYMPQYFKENNPIINLGFKTMSPVLELQYQKEERMRLRNRVQASYAQLNTLLESMGEDALSTAENVSQLKHELSEFVSGQSLSGVHFDGRNFKNKFRDVRKISCKETRHVKS
jgi:hypothetical protein